MCRHYRHKIRPNISKEERACPSLLFLLLTIIYLCRPNTAAVKVIPYIIDILPACPHSDQYSIRVHKTIYVFYNKILLHKKIYTTQSGKLQIVYNTWEK